MAMLDAIDGITHGIDGTPNTIDGPPHAIDGITHGIDGNPPCHRCHAHAIDGIAHGLRWLPRTPLMGLLNAFRQRPNPLDISNLADVLTFLDVNVRTSRGVARLSNQRGIILGKADTRSRPRRNAAQSRRAGVSSCVTERERRRFWGRPFHRTLRAINRSLRLIEASCRAVDAAERFAAERPLRAARNFELASDWLREITTHLSYAARGLSVMAGRIASSSSLPSSAPEELAAATSSWIDAVRKMESLSSRCDDSYIALLEAMAGGSLLFDLDELPGDQRVPAPRRIVIHRPPERRSLGNSRCIRFLHERRQRSARSRVAEDARRICRGRAPPFLATCTL